MLASIGYELINGVGKEAVVRGKVQCSFSSSKT